MSAICIETFAGVAPGPHFKEKSMNIIEAIKSGKRFKRKQWDNLAAIFDYCFYEDYKCFLKEDLLADDWEVEELSVTITRDKLTEAWRNSVTFNQPFGNLLLDELLKELGL
jgi:hypothetical protein